MAEKTPPSSSSSSSSPSTMLSPWKVLAILSSIAVVAVYAETMLLPAIPDLIDEFGISYSTSSWILSSFLIVGAISVPVVGRLSDMYGRKKMLMIVMGIYAAGVLAGGFATDIYTMVAARSVQGIGISFFPIVFGIVRDRFPREKLAIAQGTLISMFAFGAVIGLMAGGTITNSFGWRATFYPVAPVVVALIVVIARLVRVADEPAEKSRIDIAGIAALAATVILLLSALNFVQAGTENDGGDGNSNSTDGAGLLPLLPAAFFAGGLASLAAFILVERRSSAPLVDLKLMSFRPILLSNVIAIIIGLSMFAVFQTVPVLVRSPGPSGFGGTAADAAHVQLPFSIVALAFGPTSGYIISRMGAPRVAIAGAAIALAGFAGMLFFHGAPVQLAAGLAIIATGLSLTDVGQINMNTMATPPKHMGVSFGMNTLFRLAGASVGPAVAGMFMQAGQVTIGSASFPAPAQYTSIFLFVSALAVALVALAFALRRAISRIEPAAAAAQFK
ncbi:MAG: MFS transporter [Thermoproteota archaeon]